MRALDDVLEAMTCEVDLNSKANCWEVPVDLYGVIVHYLHEYRDVKNALDVERGKIIEAYRQWQDAKEKLEAQTSRTMWVDNHFQLEISNNPPLTWDELKTMKGKPVWVEYSNYTPNWEIVENIGAIRGSTGDFTDNFIETNKSILHKNEQGKVWQVYGKERE